MASRFKCVSKKLADWQTDRETNTKVYRFKNRVDLNAYIMILKHESNLP